MEVSVIVLSYNHPEITARTLSSLKSFEFKSTLLVHNGSTPMHQESLQTNFPNIEHLVLPTNLGFSGGANAGLTEAFKTADWCLFLTNDCVLETIGVLPTKPSIVAPKIWSRNTDRIDSLGGYFVPHKGLLQHIRNEEDFYTNSDLKYVPGTAFLLHKDIFSKTAGFDPSLFTYWEDVDFSLRLQQFGYPITIDPTWTIRHSIGKTCHKNPLYTIYYYQRNRLRISKKYTRGIDRVYLMMFLIKDYLRIIIRLLKAKRFSDLKLLKAAIFDS